MLRLALVSVLLCVACSGSKSGDQPDARITVQPDAPLVVIDAPLAVIDARVIDAGRPDALPPPPDVDAGPPIDAGIPDAPRPADAGTATCVPQCFIDIVAGLVASCVPSGSCTTGIMPPSVTVCYENGVKVTTSITTEGLVITVKKDGSVCYTSESTLSGSTATTVYQNASGATVARLIIPNLNDPLIVQYVCGDDPPITVDLTSPACQATGVGDAGVPDGGTVNCPPSASCVP